jgi:hypothetical protein
MSQLQGRTRAKTEAQGSWRITGEQDRSELMLRDFASAIPRMLDAIGQETFLSDYAPTSQ